MHCGSPVRPTIKKLGGSVAALMQSLKIMAQESAFPRLIDGARLCARRMLRPADCPRECYCTIVSRLKRRVGRVVHILVILLHCASHAFAQSAPSSSDRAWHGSGAKQIEIEARRLGESRVTLDPEKIYSLAELIDFAETHNPETHLGWERARAQAAGLGIARGELYPTLAAAALSQTRRYEILVGDRFVRQTVQDFDLALSLNYTVFDFGARSARVSAARADVLAANFAFNSTQRYRTERVRPAGSAGKRRDCTRRFGNCSRYPGNRCNPRSTSGSAPDSRFGG